jgi:hypothetical protein
LRFQIREEDAKLNSATQNAIGCALARLLDTNPGDDDDVPKLTIKKVFAICHEKFCSLIDEGMRKDRAMLAQVEPKSKVPFANCNGRPNNSDGIDSQVAKLKKDIALAQREIAKLKNQLHQAKENIGKERAERCSKSKKDDPPEDELGARETVSKLSEPSHQSRNFHHQIHHGRDSGCFRQVNIARRMK